MEIMDVMWFTGGSCVGIVQVKDEYDGIKYYIGCPPGEAKGFNEAEDIGWIADWGARFPKSIGDQMFWKAEHAVIS